VHRIGGVHFPAGPELLKEIMMLGSLLALLVTFTGSEGGLPRAGTDVPVPERTKFVEAGYPASAAAVPRKMGVVVIDLFINEEGRPTDVKVVSGIPILTTAALDVAREWRYRPTLIDGKPSRIVLQEIVDVFPDPQSKAHYFADLVKNPGEMKQLRLLAAQRLSVSPVKKDFVLDALRKASQDPDADVSAAATAALARLELK
jgi:TonB family protein